MQLPRLITSSKGQALGLTIITLVLIAMNVPDAAKEAERFWEVLMTLITLAAGFYKIATGLEDRGSTSEDLSPAGRADSGPNSMPPCLIFPLLLLTPLMGCSLITPGWDVRNATEAESSVVWDKESTLNIQESTTHDRRLLAAEGEDVSVTYYPNGTPMRIEGATHVLSNISEPRSAADAHMYLATKNAEVATKAFDIVGQILPLLSARAATGSSTRGPTLQEILDALSAYGFDVNALLRSPPSPLQE